VKLTQGERIAVLETQMTSVNSTLEELHASQEEVLAQQQKILLALTKNKGMWGGIVLTVSAVGTLLSLAKDGIVEFVTSLFR